jgi:hypothetical protein
METIKVWESWSPRWAPHIDGKYEPISYDPDTGMPEPAKVTMRCTRCGVEWQTMCSSGQQRSHIQTFAQQHLHGSSKVGM